MVDRNRPEFTAMLAAADREYAGRNDHLDVLVGMATKKLARMSPVEATSVLAVELAMTAKSLTPELDGAIWHLATAAVRLAQQKDLKVENETLIELVAAAQARNKQVEDQADRGGWLRRIFTRR